MRTSDSITHRYCSIVMSNCRIIDHRFDTGVVGTRKREYVPKHYAADGVRRHVWIYGEDPTARYPWPGLLVESHRRKDQWWGRVLFVPYPSMPGSSSRSGSRRLRCGWRRSRIRRTGNHKTTPSGV